MTTYASATTEQLLVAFQAYLWVFPLHFADFEPASEPIEKTLEYFDNQQPAASSLTVIGQTGEGSWAALWQVGREATPESRPVVWVSSDGMGNGVVATSLWEFLSLLPYGVGIITESLYVYYEQLASGQSFTLSEHVAPSPEEFISATREQDPGYYDAFLQWLKEKVGIDPAPDPVGLIEHALRTKPDFVEWCAFYNQ